MSDKRDIRRDVRLAYSAVAEKPADAHPFAVGRDFAVSLGYPAELLASLPPGAVEAFTGVSDVSLFAEIPAGATVLDLGCGAGLDTLIAARRVGPAGRVISLDFSSAMLARARRAAAEAGADQALFVMSAAETLPLPAASVDVALVNGLFNLNLAREQILRELARVVRPGGQVFAAELILRDGLGARQPAEPDDWFA